VTALNNQLTAKRLDVLRLAMPKAAIFGLLINPATRMPVPIRMMRGPPPP
jgi:hypothetical protein